MDNNSLSKLMERDSLVRDSIPEPRFFVEGNSNDAYISPYSAAFSYPELDDGEYVPYPHPGPEYDYPNPSSYAEEASGSYTPYSSQLVEEPSGSEPGYSIQRRQEHTSSGNEAVMNEGDAVFPAVSESTPAYRYVAYVPTLPRAKRTPKGTPKTRAHPYYGLIQAYVTRSEMEVIRKHYDHIPLPCLQNIGEDVTTAVRLTLNEFKNLQVFRRYKNGLVPTSQFVTDPEMIQIAQKAQDRHEKSMAKHVVKATKRNIDEVYNEIKGHQLA
ncbi:uncharacterized protein LY89DRAFT_757212 [Mollisia scopiformis]|uniref:Uncharacterized protein n=1 Tax=Mollisia scopiformis TaxID=149040 RepID=A0A194WXD1_MOLSC|nr:uncharacterized protein LY89DRAFT_757212 [Mollisia scopiformis]KUJ12638.1 hypothetical protein LY89DRAFT_757212 [Mollisia scopiformis]